MAHSFPTRRSSDLSRQGGEPARVIPLAPARRPHSAGRPQSAPRPLACSGSAAPGVHGGGLTARGRFVVGLAWVLLVVAGALAFIRPWDDAASVGPTTTVRLESGDTLWGLAGSIAPTADVRETVATILELNDLDSAGEIQAGDALIVPVAAR